VIHVGIASSCPVIREGLKSILSTAPDLHLAGELEDGAQIVWLSTKTGWNVLIIDLTLAGPENGFHVLRDIRRSHPRLAVLVLSHHPEDSCGIYVLRSGASGYLTTRAPADEVIRAVRKAAGGGKYVSSALADIMAQRLDQNSERPPHDELSAREWEVFVALASGQSTGKIAANMKLSVKTISTYRARILQKMNMATNAELMRYAIQNELLK